MCLPDATPFERILAPTPLALVRIEPDSPGIWCKLDYLNPSGSTKDRIARHILTKAWRCGEIHGNSTVAEASSGSTSIAFALACAQLGLPFVAFIPDCATSEREWIIRAYGGEVRRISGGMPAVMETAQTTCVQEGWFLGRQFANPDNTEAHRLFTGPEILAELPVPRVDAVVSGIGTGGTLRGLHEAFTADGHATRAFAAIPREGGAFASNPECCSLRFSADVPGVADGISEIYRTWRGDPATEIEVGDRQCLELTRRLWSLGFPVGPSSGLNLAAALEVARRLGPAATVVTVFPDRMERYFSHKVFEGLRSPALP
jgi:cysteine synthase A